MSNEPHVTALDMDLLALGQIAPEHVARIEAHSAACPSCAARRAEHAEHVQRFRTSVLPRSVERVVALAEPGAARRPKLPWRWLLGLAVPLTAGALLLAWGKHPGGTLDPAGGSSTILEKGPPVLRVFARRSQASPGEDDVIKVKNGDRLAAGDALRFVVQPAGLPYLLIASVDGAGNASVYYPFHGEASIAVDPRGTLSIPGSIVLDRAPGPERIFVLHSRKPVLAQTVREVLAKLGAGGARMIRETQHLPIPDTVQSTLLFEKAEGP
jgi:hypothetical protein